VSAGGGGHPGAFPGPIHLVEDGGEVARRRSRLPRGTFLEAWPDVEAAGLAWITGAARDLLDAPGAPLRVLLTIDAAHVPIYYGPRLGDLASLPAEDSVRARTLSGHGIAVALVTLDQFGERVLQPAGSPLELFFVLRRPRGEMAHRWRLFRTRAEAVIFMQEFYGTDPEAQAWAQGLAVADWGDLVARHGTAGPPAGS
jgi:hypothetical protein